MGDDGGGIQWTRISGTGRGQYEVAALMCLCGPVMAGFYVFTGADLLIIGTVFTVVFPPLGLGLWGHTVTERKQNSRLDAVGVPATAEIAGPTDVDRDGETPGVAVGLRVSGPGFRTFETTWHGSNHPGLRVGLRIDAVVDPVDGLFRVDL
ncbi:hypothetical protein [Streptomyces sp. NBC_01013]|uniref:hypothetical protein n=1 Tax=Streptomyces sp. NBC_01013 TaxID=2903718 RepID=UPI0038661450|nr:hypothetical protein OG538_08425 [Streptomyces sp. NBC_01013]